MSGRIGCFSVLGFRVFDWMCGVDCNFDSRVFHLVVSGRNWMLWVGVFLQGLRFTLFLGMISGLGFSIECVGLIVASIEKLFVW